jgi:putative oxidoreductase
MKIVVVSARILLGLMFFVFGLDTFVHFIPAVPPTEGFAGAFIGALIHSHYVFFVGGVQLIAGALLLSNRFLPLALALLAPVIANILVFHITMLPGTLPPAILAAALWAILAWKLRSYFAPLFVQKAVLS